MNSEFTIAILAGGLATRLYPETLKIPKSIIDVNGEPFIKHQLNLLKERGVKNVVLCLGNLGDMVKEYVEKNNSFGMNIKYSFDGEVLKGTGGALINAFDMLSNPFGVLYGDSFLNIDYVKILNYFLIDKIPALMTVYRNNNQWDRSNVKFINGNIEEYNKDTESEYDYIDYGYSILTKEIFNIYNSTDKFDLKEVFYNLVDAKNLYGYEVYERFYEIGSFKGIKETENYLKKIKQENGK